jgi:hypothetical protein
MDLNHDEIVQPGSRGDAFGYSARALSSTRDGRTSAWVRIGLVAE